MDELNSTQLDTSLGRYLMCLDSLDLSFVKTTPCSSAGMVAR